MYGHRGKHPAMGPSFMDKTTAIVLVGTCGDSFYSWSYMVLHGLTGNLGTYWNMRSLGLSFRFVGFCPSHHG